MPRSSRHKSSKHSSRDAREYSDSEKDTTSSKDRKSSKEENSSSRVFKESGSGEKRKLESNKEHNNNSNKESGNGEYLEEYSSSSSKRRKERAEDSGVNDRWNGGGGGDDDNNNNRGEGSKKLKEKSSSESKSKRRDESVVEIEEVVKKSSGKSEGKHKESSSRKEGREGGTEKERDREKERERDRDRERDRERERERDRRSKEGKTDRLFDGDDLRVLKQVSDKTESNTRDLLQSPESENLLDRRIRRKRDGSGDGDKRQDDIGDNNDKRLSSKEDTAKDGRLKDEKHKDEKYRDKYREDVDKESRHRDDKQRDERAAKDHVNSRSDDKHLRDDKEAAEVRPKKNKTQDSDRDRERDRDHDTDHGRDLDRDRERDRNREHDWDWDRERDRDRERERDRDRDRDRDRERNLDYDGTYMDERGARYKDSRGRKRSPEDHDDYNDAKARGGKTPYLDMEKKSLSSNRVESDTDRGRSQSRQAHPDNTRRRASPNTNSHGAADEYRQFKQEESKHRDFVIEQRSKSSRDVANLPGLSDRASKYRSSEKLNKMDDSHMGELSLERSSSSKASPMGLMDRSPSSTSLERGRYMNRSGVRRSLDIEESGRRSMGARDLSADERPSRDMPLEKSLADDLTSADSSFYNRNSQSNSALIPPSAFRGGVSSPSFLGSLEEDGRVNTGARYKRSGDPNLGRAQGNAWRGAPNWSSPVPNGYIPFQHGPPHGGFQAMMPQFPSPPMFGVRPSLEINHSGIPYHIPEADRFSAHLRPLGWQSMMDGSGPSHMHGWDGNNGVFRDESHIYGGPEWEQNRHPINGRGWESSADMWKGQNGDVNLDLPSTSLKEDFPAQAPGDDVSAGQGGQRSQNETSHLGVQAKITETKLATTPAKESSISSPKTVREKTPDPPKLSSADNVAHLFRAYLSKLDISIELADPELYGEFMSLLNIKQTAKVDEDTSMLVNLKDGARAVSKSSSILLNSSLFPGTSDSVFQRAMDIYKRQRVCLSGLPITNGGAVDVIAASKMEEQVPDNNVDVVEEQILENPAETSDVQIVDLDEKKVETLSVGGVQENSNVAASPEMDVNAPNSDLKLEASGQAPSHDIPEKSMTILGGDEMDGVPSELVDSEGPRQGDFVSTPDDVASEAKVLSADGNNINNIGKIKGSNSYNYAEGQGIGDVICDPLLLKDGCPKASGDLIPGSNESESVILSRIHHSPESTH